MIKETGHGEKMSTGRIYRLPTGEAVSSPDRYVRAWRRLGKVVARELGSEIFLSAFDPGLTFAEKDYGRAINMETEVAFVIARLAGKVRELEKHLSLSRRPAPRGVGDRDRGTSSKAPKKRRKG